MKTVGKKFGRKSKSVTAQQHLAGCEIRDMEIFIKQAKVTYTEFPEHTIDYLARMYGTELPKVMSLAQKDKQYAASLNADGEMSAQVVYAIREEMACTLMDILIRRTGIGTLGHPGKEVISSVAQIAAKELGWSKTKMEQEIKSIAKTLSLPE